MSETESLPGLSVDDEGRGAVLSADGLYRYRLTRSWDARKPILPFLMLNPSTADARQDDPTIRRCVGFARGLGYGGLGVWNLYAFRTDKPTVLWEAQRGGVDIIGPENDMKLRNLLVWAANTEVPVIAAWGAQAKPARVAWLLEQRGAHNLQALGVAKHGEPKHPLYLPASVRPQPWPVR